MTKFGRSDLVHAVDSNQPYFVTKLVADEMAEASKFMDLFAVYVQIHLHGLHTVDMLNKSEYVPA